MTREDEATSGGAQEDLVIRVRPIAGFGEAWECDVDIRGECVGGGTAGTVEGALDVAMDILYGTKGDWLNGNEGALSRLRPSRARAAGAS